MRNLTPSERSAFINRAVDQADLNSLRLALYQATGHERLAAMALSKELFWGGSFKNVAVAPCHHDELRQTARELLSRGPITAAPLPSIEETRRSMNLFAGFPLTDVQFRFGREQLAFEAFPRRAEWDDTARSVDERAKFRVVVIGAGLGGVAVGVQLERLGIGYTIIERNAGVGGTWWVNHYPDARVDVPSHQYQYTFEKNYPWKHFFATREELQEYVEKVARKHGVYDRIRFNIELTSAKWDESSCLWHLSLQSAAGGERLSVNAIISAAGLFNVPKLPDIPGIEDFQGKDVPYHELGREMPSRG